VVDYARYRDTEIDWRVTGGYGALIAALGADLPIRLNCAVTAVDATDPAIRIETSAGRIVAGGVIVTVPTAVLASGAITFTPALDDHLAAAAALPLGVADKLYFALDKPDAFAADSRLLGSTDRRDCGSYTLRPRGRPMIEGYFGGDHARALEHGGLPAFAEAGLDEIAGVLGHAIRRRLTPILATGWARDPYALGSYSHALPGQAAARAVLATPVNDRIAFAGEATSAQFFSTAHGAFESGLAAAQTMGSNVPTHRSSIR
jgi:monoamine oxidase